MRVLLAAGATRPGVETLQGIYPDIDELDEEQNPVIGDVSRVAELLDLSFGEGSFVSLRECPWSKEAQGEQDEGEASHAGDCSVPAQ